MNEFKFYYQIVPIGDGYHVVCQDKNTGKLYLHHKAEGSNPERLVFSSEQAADAWIESMNFPTLEYKSEWFGSTNIIEQFSDL